MPSLYILIIDCGINKGQNKITKKHDVDFFTKNERELCHVPIKISHLHKMGVTQINKENSTNVFLITRLLPKSFLSAK